jgi:aryl-alcohol dehydrogenase-like predicted oxidoreductase
MTSRPDVSQPMYNILARGIEQEPLITVPARNMAFSMIVYNPLAGGVTHRKQQRETARSPARASDSNQMYLDRYWQSGVF